MKLKAIFNRDGGTFRTTDMSDFCKRAEETFRTAGHDVDCRSVAGGNLTEALEDAFGDSDVDAVIAGGGDGTISAAAGMAWKAGTPLGIVPAGTMNLFARSLGLPLDIWQALEILAKSPVRAVDIATVNGRPFVHQFSAGLHARMVRLRDSMEFASRLGKIRASTRAALGVIARPPRFEVVLDVDGDGEGERQTVSAISVSNNVFGENALLVADDPAGGRLGVYLADALNSRGAASLAVDILRGRLAENNAVTAMTTRWARLQFPGHRQALCIVDGELLYLSPRLELAIHPGELKVLAPPPG